MKTCARAVLATLLVALGLSFSAASAHAQIQVNSAAPNNGSQGTISLDVVIGGSGFKKGAKAQWFVSGTTNPGGVTVNSTTFISSSQLSANITIASDAVIAGFDILVKNADGRSGKGTELFAVNTNSNKTSCQLPVPINPVVNACTSGSPQSGCLDSTFGSGGFVLTNLNTASHGYAVNSVRQQPDGKLVAIGSSWPNGVAVARYNLDGSLDTSFGSGGIAIYYLSNTTSIQTYDGVIDAAGNILATGYASGKGFVVRFTPNGSLDTSFASGGVYINASAMRGIALQPDGKLLLSGATAGTRKTASAGLLMRLNPDGSLDTSFGSAGSATLQTMGQFSDVGIQTLGSSTYIVVAGWVNVLNNPNFGVARFTSSGSLDTTFGMSGQVTNTLCGFGGQAYSVAFDPVGNIYAAGFTQVVTGGTNKLVLAKYSSIGQIDSSFGDAANTGQGLSGVTIFDDFGDSSGSNGIYFNDLTTTTDSLGNTSILVGSSQSSAFVLARFASSGALDKTFGGVGAVAATTPIGLSTSDMVLVQRDGSIVQAGAAKADISGCCTDFALVRFWP